MKTIFSILFSLLITAPLLVQFFSPFPGTKLRGVRAARITTPLAISSFLSGSYQKHFEPWFKEHLLLWGYLVKIDNQINFSLFRQISDGYSSSVAVGKDNFLMHREYLRPFNRIHVASEREVENLATRLKKLQQRLENYGVKLIILLSPSKLELYPEFVPARFRAHSRNSGKPLGHKLLIPRLHQAGVPVIDGYSLLKERKTLEKFPSFAHSGSHWNDLTSCFVTQEIIRVVEQELKKPLQHLHCKKGGVRPIPLNFDRDLTEILNLLYPAQTYRPTPSVEHRPVTAVKTFQPRILVVGTSFMWSIFRFLDAHKVFQDRNFYFYFRKKYPLYRRPQSLDTKTIDWERDVLANNIVLLEINQAWVERIGYGFVRAALRHIPRKKP